MGRQGLRGDASEDFGDDRPYLRGIFIFAIFSYYIS